MGIEIDQLPLGSSLTDESVVPIKDPLTGVTNKYTWAQLQSFITSLFATPADIDTTDASNITSGILSDTRLSSNVTKQGNSFNAANKLVKLDSSAKYPALDGSNILNIGGIPQGYIYGFTLSNNTVTPNTVIDIQDGVARDNSDTVNIKIDSVFSKSISSSFTSGSGNGGRGTGVNLVNGTWYHVFAISNGSTSDVYFDTSVSAQNIPTGYTYFRRVGSIYYIDGTSGIRRFTQVANHFYWSSPVLDIDTNASTSRNLYTISTPIAIKSLASLNIMRFNEGNYYISSPDATDLAPSTTVSPLASITDISGVADNQAGFGSFNVLTNTSSQIAIRANISSAGIKVATLGYQDISLGVVNNSASQSITGSNAQNGYVILPNGLIMQWGLQSESSVGNFPIAFPNACLNITATWNNNAFNSSSAPTNAYIISNSQFRVRCGSDTGDTLYWQAIGY